MFNEVLEPRKALICEGCGDPATSELKAHDSDGDSYYMPVCDACLHAHRHHWEAMARALQAEWHETTLYNDDHGETYI